MPSFLAIGARDTQLQACQVMAQLGGGKVVTVVNPIEDVPENVKLTNGKQYHHHCPKPDNLLTAKVMAGTIFMPPCVHVGKAIYHEFLPQALESGQIRPKPDPEVVGNGLEALNAAVATMRTGVSAKKLIVAIK